MLSKEVKDKLKKLGFNVDELETAIKAEAETDITVPEGELLTAEQLTARDKNNVNEGKKAGIAEGKQAGIEIANKTLIDKFSLKDIAKTESPEKVAEAIHGAVTSGDSGLKEQIKALQADKQTLEGRITTLETEKKTIERNTNLMQQLPKNRLDKFTDSEYITIINTMIEEVDGKQVVKYKGEVLRDDKTKDILSVDKAIEKVFVDRGWVIDGQPAGGGRGAGDGHGGKGIKTMSAAKEKFSKDYPDKNELSPEFATFVAEIAKDSPDFDFGK